MRWSGPELKKFPLACILRKLPNGNSNFLPVVDSFQYLYDGPALHRAIHRYEHCWLPLLAKHAESSVMKEPLVVPLDCEWIWHCHRLNPVQYKIDCEEIYGRVLNNMNVMSTVGGACRRQIEQLWNRMYPNERYDFAQSHHSSVSTNCTNIENQTRIKYDLVAAVKRQSSFFHKVSKSIIDDDHFFKEAVTKYKAFLHLVKRNEEKSVECHCVPTYDIDLIWHSHQLNPHTYCKDLKKIFGEILNHNDQVSDDLIDNKRKIGMTQTTKLWEDTYGRKYVTVEALLKGDNQVAPCISCWCGFEKCD